jgi:pilus assembly protein CpaC
MKVSFLKNLTLYLVLAVGIAGTAMAQDNRDRIERTPDPTAELEVPLYKSRVLSLPTSIKRISVGSPDIADLLLLRSTELYVLGKDLGTTNVLLWDADDILVAVVSVEVTHDLESLKKKLHDLMPNEAIEVRAAQRSIILSGTVSSPANVSAAVAIAKGYLAEAGTAVETEVFDQRQGGESGEVINLLQVGGAQQVMLEVKVAEISRREMRKFEMDFNSMLTSSRWTTGATSGGTTFPGGSIDNFTPNDLIIEDKGLFAGLATNDFLINLTLEAAKENGLAKILAEPNLTTLSGQEAKFLSGGEFPIPVPQGNDSVTIEFKEFGVGVGFLPVVLGDGRINMVLNIAVSELTNVSNVAVSSDSSSASFLVPSLSKRSANATVELMDGQTIGIAGLLNENMREVINKFPGLGDIPILGHLFRSQEYVKGETELVILVTPHLAKPVGPGDMELPTDNFVDPSDTDFYLWGRLEGAASAEQGAGGTTSDFGHDLD